MLERLMRIVRGNDCRLEVARAAVRASRGADAQGRVPVTARTPLTDGLDATVHELSAAISTALGEVNGCGLPVHACIGDDLVRYFMVMPPTNCTSMLDLRGAADARFQGLYGESVAPWHVVADWQATERFLACAVPSHVIDALRQGVAAQRAALVSVTPAFVEAWNRSRRDLSVDAWLATLNGATATLGLIVGGGQPRLAAVRTLTLEGSYLPMTRLCEEAAYAALLEGVDPPASLHVHGVPLDASQQLAAPSSHGAVVVRWHAADTETSGIRAHDAAAMVEVTQRGAAT